MLVTYVGILVLTWCVTQSHGQRGCQSTPSKNMKALDDDCRVDVGSCSLKECTDCFPLRFGCCTPVFEQATKTCPNREVYPYSKVIECKCLPCTSGESLIYIGGIILRCGTRCNDLTIVIDGKEMTRTKEDGSFSFSLKRPSIGRIILEIFDDTEGFFPTSKVVDILQGKQIYIVIASVQTGNLFTLFDSFRGLKWTWNKAITFHFEADSFVKENGSAYHGNVLGGVNVINRRAIPAPLLVERIGSGGPRLLGSFAMIQIKLRTQSGVRLKANGFKVSLKTGSLPREAVSQMSLWLIDPATLYWTFETNFEAVSGGRKKRGIDMEEEIIASFDLSASVEIRNIDVLLFPYCYVKVRTFFDQVGKNNQMGNVEIISFYNTLGITNELTTNTNSNGACVPVQCNSKILDDIKMQANDFIPQPTDFPAETNSLFTTSIEGSLSHIINFLTDDRAALPNGPIYDDFSNCQKAPFTDYYFGLVTSGLKNGVKETNTVEINEQSINSPWIDNLFSWWPNRKRFKACFISIKIQSSERGFISYKVQSIGGTHSVTKRGLYGTRDISNDLKFACIEYKCPDTLPDGETDRARITVTITNDKNEIFHLSAVNPDLYSSAEYNAMVEDQISNSSHRFTALVPILSSAYGSGVYEAEDIQPAFAKLRALEMCTSSLGTALTFSLSDDESGSADVPE